MFKVVQLPAVYLCAFILEILPTFGMMMSLRIVSKLALFDKVQLQGLYNSFFFFRDIVHFLYYDVTGSHILFWI